jgi:hypothetical protein
MPWTLNALTASIGRGCKTRGNDAMTSLSTLKRIALFGADASPTGCDDIVEHVAAH